MDLTHTSLANALADLDVPVSVAEVHGICCGLLCTLSTPAAKTRWFAELLEAGSQDANSVSVRAGELKLLDQWFLATVEALNDVDLEFSPCLPEDTTGTEIRLRALGEFCSGFTYAIGLAAVTRGSKPLPPDTREIIEDFQAIESVEPVSATNPTQAPGSERPVGKASGSSLSKKSGRQTLSLTGSQRSVSSRNTEMEFSESVEQDFQELFEYVRVGVLLILEELKPTMPSGQEQPS